MPQLLTYFSGQRVVPATRDSHEDFVRAAKNLSFWMVGAFALGVLLHVYM